MATEKTAPHSPTPWHRSFTERDGLLMLDARDRPVIKLWAADISKADQAFIVQCVNHHQQLVDALRECAAGDSAGKLIAALDNARSVLAALERGE